jgi:hypothetical protein
VDKSLSLRLGRPSTIQDFDVTVPYTPRNNQGHTAITSFFQLWVIASRIQGQIYELLYCPEAIAQPEPVRRSRVQLLVGRLEELDTLTREATVSLANPYEQRTLSDCGNLEAMGSILEGGCWRRYCGFLHHLGPGSPLVAPDPNTPSTSKSGWISIDIHSGLHPSRQNDARPASGLHDCGREEQHRPILDLYELVCQSHAPSGSNG